MSPLSYGDPARIVFRKFDDAAHWENDSVYLGRDEYGVWLGAPAGTPMSRPGVHVVADVPFVTLLPDDRGFVASFNGAPRPGDAARGLGRTRIYVDITTVPVWTGTTVRCIDLDLDVIARRDGDIFIDDEDEFAEHSVSLAYPATLIADARAECARVFAEVTAGTGPYAAGPRWLADFEAATDSPHR